MTVYPPDWEGQHRAPSPSTTPPEEEGLFARIEGLVGQEAAMLSIPAQERSPEQRERLHSIASELDRVFEHLRERARQLARPEHEARDTAAG